ncbi:T9SS type A sorting domain-containing protein [Flavobacterium sp.]|uniref:T9SS type A sorting domain-containing protein n=1 Tax=Flavobacterium sp. TaxID=239 RepID=UPI00286AAD6D|nr:T9SS type A sorting domain-containing protein [Flavobacterium sp.]
MKKITLLVSLFAVSLGIAQPTTNAPVPTNNATDVISIYGETFTSIATNYNPNWGQSGLCCVDQNYNPGSGNLVLAYTSFNYQGTELTTTNASNMEFLHIDVWTDSATDLKVSPINNGTGVGEILVNVPLVNGGWSSIDIPKTAFTGMTWDSLFQLKFDAQGGTNPAAIYLDNIYFWKNPTIGTNEPVTNAPDPTRNAVDVISIYSGTYTNIATNYNPNWGQSGFGSVNPSYDPGTGNLILAYPNFNYQGTELTTQNASGMEFLHIDIWTTTATSVKVSPINNGTGVGEFLVDVPILNGGWSSVDLPKSAFTGMTWDSVFQLKFDGQGGVNPSTIYLDNIYFWKAPLAVGSDATLSSLQVDGVSVTGFSPAANNYTYELVVGTTDVPQITLATTTDAAATVTSITQATAIPGTATVLVTSQNGNVTNTYTISFTATLPNPSPTPSTPPAEVLSIYSDTGAFTNTWISNYNFGVNSGQPDLDPGTGVNQAIKMNFAVAGYGEGTNTATDISTYNWVHFDYFADANSTQIRFILIGGGEFYYELSDAGNAPIVTGSWQSVNIPLSFFVGIGFNKTNFLQYKLGTTSDLVSDIVYFDNIYFSQNQGTVLSTKSNEAVTFNMYPNPANNSVTIDARNTIDTVSIYNVLGQEVMVANPNAAQTTLDISNLNSGVYIVRTSTEGKVATSRLIKK